MKNSKGFTLTELLAVIAIMAILAVAAISGYSTMTKNSKKKTFESKVSEIENAAIKFAKETNLKNSTTISVNKLVVQGYFQPDESTANGLAAVNNPINGDNMICNMVTISIYDDIYVAEYKEKDKDCNIADQELADANIRVAVRELNGSSIGSDVPVRNSVANWTGKDVVVITSSSVYTDFVSVSYDFGGQTITKVKNTPSSSTRYVESDYNKVAIKDVKVMFNSEVTVTYNMADGTVKSRTIIVRIDKEAPTSRPVVSNDATVGSTKKVDLYLDDGNGSGVVGFYLSSSPTSFSSSGYINSTTNRPGKNHGDGKFKGYNSYFYAQKGTYYVKVVDAVGNSYITPAILVANFEPTSKTCTMAVRGLAGETWAANEIWYNKSVRVTGTTNNAVGSMGVKYIVNHFASVPVEKDLKKYFDGQSNNGILTDYKDQTEESDQRTYYLAMKGQGRNEAISYCTKRLGVDKHSPTATLTCTDNDCGTYKKTHRITITLNDDRSGFYTDAFNIQIGWSLNKSTLPTKWQTLSGGGYKAGTKERVVEFTTSVNKYNDETKALTGIYYMWVKGESFSDKAHNKGALNFVTSFAIKYDNTKPGCTSSGGDANWYNYSRKIYGKCSDDHSGCAKVTDYGKYTYDNSGKVTRTVDYEINSTVESPGEVYDKAGNHTTCPGDQTVKIDLTKPSCGTVTKTNTYNTTGVNVSIGCTDALSKCTSDTFSDTGKKSSGDLTIKDTAGNTKDCSFTISSGTKYQKRTCDAYNSCVNDSCSCNTYNSCQSEYWCGSTPVTTYTAFSLNHSECSSEFMWVMRRDYTIQDSGNCRTTTHCCVKASNTYYANSCPNPTCSCAQRNSCRHSSCGCETWGSWSGTGTYYPTASCSASAGITQCNSAKVYW